MMTVVVQQLSDKDVEDLAAYYAAIEVTVKVPARSRSGATEPRGAQQNLASSPCRYSSARPIRRR